MVGGMGARRRICPAMVRRGGLELNSTGAHGPGAEWTRGGMDLGLSLTGAGGRRDGQQSPHASVRARPVPGCRGGSSAGLLSAVAMTAAALRAKDCGAE